MAPLFHRVRVCCYMIHSVCCPSDQDFMHSATDQGAVSCTHIAAHPHSPASTSVHGPTPFLWLGGARTCLVFDPGRVAKFVVPFIMTTEYHGEPEVCESLRLMALCVIAVLCEVSLFPCTREGLLPAAEGPKASHRLMCTLLFPVEQDPRMVCRRVAHRGQDGAGLLPRHLCRHNLLQSGTQLGDIFSLPVTLLRCLSSRTGTPTHADPFI